MALQDVLPRTQYPPPPEACTQTQDELELQGTNVAQVAPAHSGFGPPLAAAVGTAEPRTIGAT